MSADHSLEVLTLFGNGTVHAFLEHQLQGLQLASQSLGTTSEPQDHELALSRLPAAMRVAKEVKGLRFALSRAASVLAGKTSELGFAHTLTNVYA